MSTLLLIHSPDDVSYDVALFSFHFSKIQITVDEFPKFNQKIKDKCMSHYTGNPSIQEKNEQSELYL